MARVRDLATVVRRVGFFPFTKKVWAEVNDDNVFMMASALAYAWLFAIFPFLIFLISLLPYLPERVKDSATNQLHHVLVENLPKKAEDVVDSVNSFMNAPKG